MSTSTKPQLGNKYTCFKCASKFYDLGRTPAICPKCSADQKEAPPDDPKKMRERLAARDTEPEAEETEPVERPERDLDDDDLPAFGEDVDLTEEEDDDEDDDEE